MTDMDVDSENLEYDPTWGWWCWGCCDGKVFGEDSPSIRCDNNEKCFRFYHAECLRRKFEYPTHEIDILLGSSKAKFVCPFCTTVRDTEQQIKDENIADKLINENSTETNQANTTEKPTTSTQSSSPLGDITNVTKDDDDDVVMEDSEMKDSASSQATEVDCESPIKQPTPMDEDEKEPSPQRSVKTDVVMEESTSNDAAGETTNGDAQEDDDDYDGPTIDPIDLNNWINTTDLSADQKKMMESRLGALQVEYKESVVRQRELRLQEIKNGFKFNVDQTITDEEASFIHDFCKKHQFDVMEKIEDEGVFFLSSIREMLEERKRQKALNPNKKRTAAERKKIRRKKRERRRARILAERAAAGEDVDDIDFDESGSEWEASDFDDSDDSDYIGSDMDMNDIGADLIDSEPESCEDEGDWVEDSLERKRKRRARRRLVNPKKGYKLDGQKRVGRLLLDDALKDKDSKDGWSEARIKAYEQRESNPNSYYYRFNDPGEKQRGGEWDKKEQKKFMLRLKEMGANVRWGVFSMTIPGRVGYQCSNYYRQLILTKQIHDPNYTYAGGKLNFRRGKLKLNKKVYGSKDSDAYKQYAFIVKSDPTGVWTNLPARHPKCPKFALKLSENTNDDDDGAEEEQPDAADAPAPTEESGSKKTKKKATKKKRKGKKRRSNPEETAADEPARKKRRTEGVRKGKKKKDDTYRGPASKSKTPQVDENNPLPELIDMITNLPVIKPAISPYGHVLGYQTWTRILNAAGQSKNKCPFTKQKLTRRQLVKLNHENINEYKEKIVNITSEELAGLNISA